MFAIRGLMNSYRIPEDMKQHIRNINVRHDASGRYPQTGPDYPEEDEVLSEARKPLDDLHAFVRNIDSGSDSESGNVSEHMSDDHGSPEEEGMRMDLDPS